MKIEITVKLKTEQDIKDCINGSTYSTWSKKQKELEINNCIQANKILIENIDMGKYKKAILEEVIWQSCFGDMEKKPPEYDIVELMLKHRDQLPKIMVVDLLSEYSGETMDSFYPDATIKVVE